jgi:hypothetical protein
MEAAAPLNTHPTAGVCVFFILNILVYMGCGTSGSEEPVKENPVQADSGVKAADTGASDLPDTGEPALFVSTASATHSRTFTYSRMATEGNPLKGFLTSYQWSSPSNQLAHSLEFVYLPLSSLVLGEGVYAFDDVLEPILTEASARGNQLVMRAYIDYPAQESGLPAYLDEEVGCTPYDDHGGGCSPDYSNPALQSAVLDYIAALGARYDGDRRMGFVQVGLLGFWGEWHTYPETGLFAGDSFQQAVITAFDQAFALTPFQLRKAAQDSAERDIGYHDDSFAHSTIGETDWFFQPSLDAAGAGEAWRMSPIGGELRPELQQSIFTDGYAVGEYSQDFHACVEETHASYLLNFQAFSMGGAGYQGVQLERAREASLSMGYEYYSAGVRLLVSGLSGGSVDATLEVDLENVGVAPFYHPLALEAAAETDSWRLEGVESIQPGEAAALVFDLGRIGVSVLEGGLSIRLVSDYILEEQVIRFAAVEDNDGRLDFEVSFGCSSGGSGYAPEESAELSGQTCYCDIDGVFRTLGGEVC